MTNFSSVQLAEILERRAEDGAPSLALHLSLQERKQPQPEDRQAEVEDLTGKWLSELEGVVELLTLEDGDCS
jgi:hypothetical protein